ncbi:glycosyltransferase family 2 protein [Dyadobacter tibetensis]|uniref:glycosyltransferase family 2 protein n=1 Tax=Dyadobacter tibetensis TaxID=1211851 RepID=UPI0004B32EAB|nr:glycosyltransferase family 2 protein [Dyadobacter tibetensis]
MKQTEAPPRPILTIITITYQAERFLERTLKSIDASMEMVQNKGAIEYLIIDGGSTDGTLSIAQRYSHLITTLCSEPDRGLYDAMNKGQERAVGTYLWFMNAGDEIFDSHTLARLMTTLESEADVYYSDAMFVRENGSEVGLRSECTPHKLPTDLNWRDFTLGMKVCHQAFIARKRVTSTYPIDNLSADIDWEIKCLKRSKKTEYIPQPLCRYLIGGLSVQNHRRSLVDRFYVLTRHFGLLPTLWNHVRILVRGIIFSNKKRKYW